MIKLVQIPLSPKIEDRRINDETIKTKQSPKCNACYFTGMGGS